MKLYVIGNEDAVLGFSLAGVDGYATTDRQEALDRMGKLLRREDLGIIMITSDLADQMRPELETMQSQATMPLVLEIPAPGQQVRHASFRELLRRAVGVSI